MATERIERLLGALSKEELRKLEYYLESEYFPMRKGLRAFGQAYLKARKRPAWDGLTAQKKWRLVMKQPYKDGDWRKLKSELATEVEKFLVLEARQKGATTLSDTVVLLAELDRRRLDQDFEGAFERAVKVDLPEKGESWNDLLEGVRFWEMAYNYWIERQDPNQGGERETKCLTERLAAFERFITFDYLKTANCIENRSRMRRSSLRFPLPPHFSEMLSQQRDVPNALIQAYIHLFDVLQEEDAADFPTFLNIVSPAIQQAAMEEAALLFDYAVNLFVRRYLTHPTMENSQSILELYRLGLERDILRWPKGWISAQHYKNICISAIRAGETKLLREFVANYRERISPDLESVNILGLCDAYLQFSDQEYSLCIKTLNKIDRNKYLKVETRTLEIKAFFEMNDYDVVETKLNSFEKFLQRSEYPANRRNALLNRIKIMRKIIALDLGDGDSVFELVKQIQVNEVLDSEWLIDYLKRKLKNPAP